MNGFSLLALVSAGHITENDDTLAIIQNISQEHAHSIAKWLALATNGPVNLRYMTLGDAEEIQYTPAQVRAGMRNAKDQ